MMLIVRDACVEVGTEHAVKLLEDPDVPFLAPDIFPAEVANGLLRQHREGHLTQALLEAALAELRTVMPQLVSSAELLASAVALGRRLGHPVYDCLHLALADRSETVFVTADEKLIELCRKQLGDDPLVGRLRILREYSPS